MAAPTCKTTWRRAKLHAMAALGRYLREKASMLMIEPSRIGKSHLMQALGHRAVRQGLDVVFASCAGLADAP